MPQPKTYLARRIGWLLLAVVSATTVSVASEQEAVHFFESKVRPILQEHCVSCHGPEKQKSALRLDTGEGLHAGGSRGPVVVPGAPEASLLYQVVAGIGDLEMPPAGPLSQEDVAVLKQWLTEGAVWPNYDPSAVASKPSMLDAARDHWAFQPVAMPPLPVVNDETWTQGPVDKFVRAKMEEEGVSPALPASKAALLRRVSIELVGLPPTPEELAAFLADDSPDAFGRVVERLLQSPHYGERWARHWLDVVRYTDSFDSRASTLTDPVEIWRYRDWVVKAFNEDMPYDQFLRYQIAGDIYAQESGKFNRDGLVATGVLAIGNWPQGDADKEKMVCDIVDDQVDLVTRGFLGLTVSCARCHDHKFEPFSTEDYYGLAGIFFSSSILPGPGAKTEGSPILHLPLASKEELAERVAREERVAALRNQISSLVAEEGKGAAVREAQRTGDYLLAALGSNGEDTESGTPLQAEAIKNWQSLLGLRSRTLDGLSRDVNNIPGLHARRGTKDMPSAVINLSGKDQHYVTIAHPKNAVVLHPSPDKPAAIKWQSPIAGNIRISTTLVDVDSTCGNGFHYRLELGEGADASVLAEGDVENSKSASIELAEHFPIGLRDSLLLYVDPRGDYSCDSTTVEWQIVSDTGEVWDFRAVAQEHFLAAGAWPDHAGRPDVWLLHDPNVAQPSPALQALLSPVLDKLNAQTQEPLAWRATVSKVQQDVTAGASGEAPHLKATYDELVSEKGPFWMKAPPSPEGSPRPALEAELRELEANPLPQLDLAVGIQEGAVPSTAYSGTFDVRVHRRGDYNNLGEVVPRRMPVVLAGETQPAIAKGSGRRELAEWVGSKANPLTARVMVNRIWLHHFGAGIVRTPGDFGTRGEAPTHPELLDYLAAVFMDSGWSVKAIHRLILNSATYQQSTQTTPGLLQQDPENLLFARMNRQRIEAEILRDSLLAVTGRLDPTPGGPAYADMNIPRRTIYLKTNRSDRTTFATLFDAADPTAIIPKRVEATVAPQALFLMNHPFMLSASEQLAARMEPLKGDVPAMVRELYLRLYARESESREVELAQAFLQGSDQSEATALSAYCQALLSANEFVFID